MIISLVNPTTESAFTDIRMKILCAGIVLLGILVSALSMPVTKFASYEYDVRKLHLLPEDEGHDVREWTRQPKEPLPRLVNVDQKQWGI